MTAGILDRVRQACSEVVRRAGHVAIDEDMLDACARELPPALTLPQLDPRCHLLDQGPDTATFMLVLEAVNFGSAYFPELRPYDGMRGYFAVSAALRDRCVRAGVPTARQLSAWSWEDCAEIFGQDPAHPPVRELMMEFARAERARRTSAGPV